MHTTWMHAHTQTRTRTHTHTHIHIHTYTYIWDRHIYTCASHRHRRMERLTERLTCQWHVCTGSDPGLATSFCVGDRCPCHGVWWVVGCHDQRQHGAARQIHLDEKSYRRASHVSIYASKHGKQADKMGYIIQILSWDRSMLENGRQYCEPKLILNEIAVYGSQILVFLQHVVFSCCVRVCVCVCVWNPHSELCV